MTLFVSFLKPTIQIQTNGISVDIPFCDLSRRIEITNLLNPLNSHTERDRSQLSERNTEHLMDNEHTALPAVQEVGIDFLLTRDEDDRNYIEKTIDGSPHGYGTEKNAAENI